MIKLIVFDAGDTVLRDMPQYSGPMVSWPHLEPMPGIEAALQALKRGYRLAVASNAAESGADLMRDALARVGLDGYFDAFLTARDLGVSKPDPMFFDALLAASDCLPHEAVMVGDSYRTDVVGAKLASLWAVWYNPARADPPGDTALRPDAEIESLSELVATIHALDLHAPGSV